MSQDKSPTLAVALSIIPGAGFLYLRELRWAAMWLGVFAAVALGFFLWLVLGGYSGSNPIGEVANLINGVAAIIIFTPVALLLKVLEFFHVYTVATRKLTAARPTLPAGGAPDVQDEIAELRARLARLEGEPGPES